jgi:hypothetical protein
MPANDREVFDYLTSDPETSPAIDFGDYRLEAGNR